MPKRKQVRLTIENCHQPGPCSSSVIAELLVFPTSPANQRLADMPLDGPERGRREAPIVVEPSPKFGIDLPCKLLEGLPRTAMQLPSSNLVPDLLSRLLRHGWAEATKDLPLPTVRSPRPKRVPQKVELLVRVSPLTIGILAIDHLRLLRMQLQSTLLQPCRYFDTHQVRFPLCSAMDDDIVRVPLERQMNQFRPIHKSNA